MRNSYNVELSQKACEGVELDQEERERERKRGRGQTTEQDRGFRGYRRVEGLTTLRRLEEGYGQGISSSWIYRTHSETRKTKWRR